MKPKKLIRNRITEKLKAGEWETITDQKELNRLYALKIQEELAEIQASKHQDVMEFADLIDVAISFALENGFTEDKIFKAISNKHGNNGYFDRTALNNLNPNNPSNKLYFEQKPLFAKIGSKEIIGNVQQHFKNLSDYKFDWKSFYNGWIEGRTQLVFGSNEQTV